MAIPAWINAGASAVSALGNLFGGSDGISPGDAYAANRLNYEHMPTYLVRGAERAGLHPLAVLGHNWPTQQAQLFGGSNKMAGFDAMGQNIARAWDASRTQKEREEAQIYERIERDQAVRHNELQNDYLAIRIAAERLAMHQAENPPFPDPTTKNPIPGQPASGFVDPGGKSILNAGPGTSAQEWEERYGELAGEVAGIGNLVYDVVSQGHWLSPLGYIWNKVKPYVRYRDARPNIRHPRYR